MADPLRFGILAAGEGSRLVKEGIVCPKPLTKVGERTILHRLMGLMQSCGAEEISIITNSDMPDVAQEAQEAAANMGIITKLHVKTTPSSMHSFFELSKDLKDNQRIILSTVDSIFNQDDFRLYVDKCCRSADIDALMGVTTLIDDESPLYVSADVDGTITGFHDKAKPGAAFISGGVYCLGSRAIEVLNRCMTEGVSRMRNYQRALITEGLNVKMHLFGDIIDIDHAADIAKAKRLIKKWEA